jgi:adenylate cyclase
LDFVRVKGKKTPVAICELLGLAPPDPELAQFLDLYHQGLRLFRERQWGDSILLFEQALRLRPEDHHSQRYVKLVQRYLAEPPGPDWEGLAIWKTSKD